MKNHQNLSKLMLCPPEFRRQHNRNISPASRGYLENMALPAAEESGEKIQSGSIPEEFNKLTL
ncbi:MAG: hypothetical protein IPG51_17245 [Chloroflexi bacterium]|nr:hypothetical protein [Chloroflexota bacterium]MBK8932039.1 hypothetical protein [Chloroflexota bacterium]